MNPNDVLAHLDAGTAWTGTAEGDVVRAYADALAVRALRVARGEHPLGYKVGFTNRTIWPRYRVFAPIWGTVWDTTLVRGDASGTLDITRTCEPRIEPEACFGVARTPPPDATLADCFDCVAWVAPSFEIVQSHRPGWVFTLADTVLDGALHGRLLVGRPTPVRAIASSADAFAARLAATRVTLSRGEALVESGVGANVLDGPLQAFRHFVRELAACPGAPTLVTGDVVTTGTWTDAWPVVPGETWTARYDDALPPLTVTLR